MPSENGNMFTTSYTGLSVIGEQSLCYCRHAVSICYTKPATGLSHLGVGVLVYEERFCVQHTTYAEHLSCVHAQNI